MDDVTGLPRLAAAPAPNAEALGYFESPRWLWGLLAFLLSVFAVALWLWPGSVVEDKLTSTALERRATAVVVGLVAVPGWLAVCHPGVTRDGLRRFWVTNLLVGGLLAGILLVAWPASAKFLPDHQTDLGFVLAGLSMGALLLVHRDHRLVTQFFGDNRRVLGCFVLLFGFCVGLGQTWERHLHGEDLQGIGLLGVITLLTVLVAGSLLTGTSPLSVRHVRTAITVSTLAVFFAIVGFGANETLAPDSVLGKALENFWAVLMAVVGFYFGGETWERVAKARRGGLEPEEPPKPAKAS